MDRDENIDNAIFALKEQIKFLQAALGHLKGKNLQLKSSAFLVAWNLDNYFRNGLEKDVENCLVNITLPH
jgi:uncharacterized protein (UPF0303 family)